MKKVALTIIFILSLHCSASLIVTPAIFEGNVKDYPDVLTVDLYNPSSSDILVEVEVVNLSQGLNGIPKLSPSSTPQIVPKKEHYYIEAKSKATVEFERLDPKKMLYQAAVIKRLYTESTGMSQGVAVLFMLNSGVTENDGEVMNVKAKKDAKLISLEFAIKNRGVNHIKTESKVKLFVENDQVADEIEIAKGVVLPGVERVFNIAIPDNIQGKEYTKVVLVVKCEEKTQKFNIDLTAREGKGLVNPK